MIITDVTYYKLKAIAKRISDNLFPGAFLALYGELGAGKTELVRAVAENLGIGGVMSPTFMIVREHTEGRLPLFHFDAYRLSSADELYDIGFDDYLTRGGVIAVEWPQNVSGALPADRLDISIYGSGGDPRTVEIEATGDKHRALLVALEGLI